MARIPRWMRERFGTFHELEPVIEKMLAIPKTMPGDIIECGVFGGLNTIKFSIVAKHLGRRLIACDSFMGLPEPEDHDKMHIWHWEGVVREVNYRAGQFATPLDSVKATMAEFGEPDVVDWVPGWFKMTLPRLKRQICFVVLDVDLIESIKTCIENLWPYLGKGCYFFTHEAVHDLTVDLFNDRKWWRETFGIKPPDFYANHPRAKEFMPGHRIGFGYAVKETV